MDKDTLNTLIDTFNAKNEKLEDMLSSVAGMHGEKAAGALSVPLEYFSVVSQFLLLARGMGLPTVIVNAMLLRCRELHVDITGLAMIAATEQHIGDDTKRKAISEELTKFVVSMCDAEIAAMEKAQEAI